MRSLSQGIAAVCLSVCLAQAAHGDNWPAWRGPYGNSACAESNVPLIWGEQRNRKFRTEIPGEGASSPVVWDDAIFVTSQDGESLLLLRINRADGAVVWQREVGRAKTPREASPGEQQFHESHNLASPTPTTDGEIVVAAFGNGLTAAYDFDGNQLWQRDLQREYGRFSFRYGYATSPLLFDDVVISTCLHRDLTAASDTAAGAFLVAHDKQTGHMKWKTSRAPRSTGEGAEIYGTPALRKNAAGEVELVVMGAGLIDAYRPSDGVRVWSLAHRNGGRAVCSPTIVGESLIGMITTERLFLLDLPQQPNQEIQAILQSDYKWKAGSSVPETCSPVIWGDLLFTITDEGQVTCLDVTSGRRRWRNKLPGTYRASPIVADGRVYFLNDAGLCTVIAASARFGRLAENQIQDRTLASIAISNRELFIRGDGALHCITRY